MIKNSISSSAAPAAASTSSSSLAFSKIVDSSQIQFPDQEIYYIYRPPRSGATAFQQLTGFLSLYYYKYLLHSGIYVMTRNERRIVNSIVVLSVILSTYQLFSLIFSLFSSY